MQAPRRTNLYPYHRSPRSEHTRRAPADRSANFNTLPCHPRRRHPHQVRTVRTYGLRVSCRLTACVCVRRARSCGCWRERALRAARATERRVLRACRIVSLLTCVCAYNDADVFDAGGIWEATGAAMGRRTEKRDAFLHNRKHAVAHTRARERGRDFRRRDDGARPRASERTSAISSN